MAKADGILEQVAQAARNSGGRSKLFLWMRANRTEFAALVEEHRPNWKSLAEAFAAQGFTTPGGGPLKPASVRHTWYRVRRAVAAGQAKRAARVAPVEQVAVERPAPAPSKPETAPRAPEGGLNAKDALAELRRQINERSGRR